MARGRVSKVTESEFNWLVDRRRPRVRHEERDDIYDVFLHIEYVLIYWKRYSVALLEWLVVLARKLSIIRFPENGPRMSLLCFPHIRSAPEGRRDGPKDIDVIHTF